jgi:F0F1-type ATP synthase assembly protein I
MIWAMADTDPRRDDTGLNYARFFGLGFAFIVTLGVFTVAGYFLDRVLGTLPLFLLIGLAVGFAGGLYYVYQALKKLDGG